MSLASVEKLLAHLLADLVRRGGDDVGPAPVVATAADWEQILPLLLDHRLAAAVAHRLELGDRLVELPPQVRAALYHQLTVTRATNGIRMALVRRLLVALNSFGVDPIFLKGVALVHTVYSDLGARPMGDVDILVAPPEMAVVADALSSLRCVESGRTEDTVQYRGPGDMVFDVHERFRIFEHMGGVPLTESVPAEDPASPPLRILAPDAALAHLICHLQGHRPAEGCLLGWVVDIGLLLTRDGSRMTADRTLELILDPGSRRLLFRVLGFLRCGLAMELPDPLGGLASEEHPLTLEEILRSRRLALWRLPGLRGWLRLLACASGLRSRGSRPWPAPSDPLLFLVDATRDRRARESRG
jgi:hypothetical protein